MKKKTLSDYLALNYPFRARIDPDDGSFFVDFPDLPGCMTGADSLEELPAMIREAMEAWLGTTYEVGQAMPLPSQLDLDEPSGRFNLRVPTSLHSDLTEAAASNGVSLNQYVVSLLSRGDAQARIEARLVAVEAALGGSAGAKTRVADDRTAYGEDTQKKRGTAKKSAGMKKRSAARARKGKGS